MRPMAVAALALVSCHNWEEAIAQYNSNHFDSGVKPAIADGQPCGVDADCKSEACQAGVCTSSPQATLGGACGDKSDCVSGAVCEPNFSNGVPTDYVCKADDGGTCAPYGRLATTLAECTGNLGSCTSAQDTGICRRLAQCAMQGTACLQHSDCCAGSVCNARDGGTCTAGELGALPNGFPCNAPDQCMTRFCLGNDVCNTPACTPVGNSGIPACCPGTTENTMGVCLITNNGSPCQSDASCPSGQCLAGRCSVKENNSVVLCRQTFQLCLDDNDCCTGLCDVVKKQCFTKDVTLRDGGHCDVDIFTKTCANDAGFSCRTPRVSTTAASECCSGSRDSNTGVCN
jgi:hypothetical protein